MTRTKKSKKHRFALESENELHKIKSSWLIDFDLIKKNKIEIKEASVIDGALQKSTSAVLNVNL